MVGNLFDHKYPYSDFHELNLDWIIKNVEEVRAMLDTIVKGEADEIIEKYLNKLLPEAVYDADNERLILSVSVKLYADGEHVYDADNETMTIEIQ